MRAEQGPVFAAADGAEPEAARETETAATAAERILVIKHGALGDFLLATGAMAAISAHHAQAHITLLTTAGMREVAEACPYFDEIWLDRKPGWLNLPGWWGLGRRLRRARFRRIYDLQTSRRSSRYFLLTGLPGRRPEWSGTARGCSHPDADPERLRLHPVERLAGQLAQVGLPPPPPPSIDWLDADVSRFDLPERYVLLVPGGAAHRPEKRWPAAHYAALARLLVRRGATPVAIGAAAEREAAETIADASRDVVNLVGQTSLAEVAGLARRAAGAVGNDTGPMHLIAAAGAPSVVLFGHASDPKLSGPRGPAVTLLRRTPLSGLSVGEVEAALRLR